MNDKNLLRAIKIKLCTIPARNYKEIEELNLTNKNFLGNTLNINLEEIVELEELKTLSIKFFDITDEVIDSINTLKKLCKIEFYMCDFKTNKVINGNIRDVTIYCCKGFKQNILNDCINLEILELTNSGITDVNDLLLYKKIKSIKIRDCSLISLPKISALTDLEYIYLNNIDIQCDFEISKMKKLKYISLNGSDIPDKESYIQKLKVQNPNVEIECRENDLPIE